MEIPDSISKHLLINSLRRKDVIIEGLEKNYYTNSQTDQRLKLDVANIDIEKSRELWRLSVMKLCGK